MTILCSLMLKDLFGAVEAIQMDNWEAETQQTEAKQKELQDFQKSHPSLPSATLHFFWMLKDQFGLVAEMIGDNWDWDIQRTRPKQRRLQEFLQSKAWQEDTFIHCFLILKDQFGPVDTMLKENWDWETQQTETKQKRLQDFQESTQFQEEIITLILLMKREVFGCGYNGNGQLGLGHSTNQSKAVRNDRLVNIVAASGGDCCSMFLDKDGNLFTCGRNQYGQLGLGDKTDRNIPEKVNNVPKICSLSPGCTSRHNVAVDCEGSVWSCGNNQNGQLGVGDCNSRMHF